MCIWHVWGFFYIQTKCICIFSYVWKTKTKKHWVETQNANRWSKCIVTYVKHVTSPLTHIHWRVSLQKGHETAASCHQAGESAPPNVYHHAAISSYLHKKPVGSVKCKMSKNSSNFALYDGIFQPSNTTPGRRARVGEWAILIQFVLRAAPCQRPIGGRWNGRGGSQKIIHPVPPS